MMELPSTEALTCTGGSAPHQMHIVSEIVILVFRASQCKAVITPLAASHTLQNVWKEPYQVHVSQEVLRTRSGVHKVLAVVVLLPAGRPGSEGSPGTPPPAMPVPPSSAWSPILQSCTSRFQSKRNFVFGCLKMLGVSM